MKQLFGISEFFIKKNHNLISIISFLLESNNYKYINLISQSFLSTTNTPPNNSEKRFLIIDNGTSTKKKLCKLVQEYGKYELVSILDFQEEKAKEYDAIILSGSSKYPSNHEIFDDIKEFIRTTDFPLLGICLGYQLIISANDPEEMFTHRLHHKPKIHGLSTSHDTDGKLHYVFKSHRYSYIVDTTSDNVFEILTSSTHGNDGIVHKTQIPNRSILSPRISQKKQRWKRTFH